MAAPLQLQTDLIQTVTQAKYVAQRAQDAYLMRTWQGRQKHRLQFAGTLVVLMAVVSVLRLDAGLFPGWSTERLVSAAVVELMASVGLFAATYFTTFQTRHVLHHTSAGIYVVLVIALLSFNVLAGARLGLLSILVLTQLVYAFPAAFPMPLGHYSATTVLVVVIIAAFLAASRTFTSYTGGVTVLLLVLFVALTAVPQVALARGQDRQLSLLSNLERQSFTQLLLLQRVIPRQFIGQLFTHERIVSTREKVSVLFCEVLLASRASDGSVTWSKMGSNLNPSTLSLLGDVFTKLDAVVKYHGVFKVETIGSEYMVVSGVWGCALDHNHLHAQPPRYITGLPAGARHASNSAVALILTAIDMMNHVSKHPSFSSVALQIGINSGTVVETILGRELLPRWKLFGDTVNTASRMKSHGGPGRIHVSLSTRGLVMDTVMSTLKHTHGEQVSEWNRRNSPLSQLIAGPDMVRPRWAATQLDRLLPDLLGFKLEPLESMHIKGKGLMQTFHVLAGGRGEGLMPLDWEDSTHLGRVEEAVLGWQAPSVEGGTPSDTSLDEGTRASLAQTLRRNALRMVTLVDGVRQELAVLASRDSLDEVSVWGSTSAHVPVEHGQQPSSVTGTPKAELGDAGRSKGSSQAAMAGLQFMRVLSMPTHAADRVSPMPSLPSQQSFHSTQALRVTTSTSTAAKTTSRQESVVDMSEIAAGGESTHPQPAPRKLAWVEPAEQAPHEVQASEVVPPTRAPKLGQARTGGRRVSARGSVLAGSRRAGLGRGGGLGVSMRMLEAAGAWTLPKQEMDEMVQTQGLSNRSLVEDFPITASADLAGASEATGVADADPHEVHASPEQVSNAIPVPDLSPWTLHFKGEENERLEALFRAWTTGRHELYLRGVLGIGALSLASVACTTSSLFVHDIWIPNMVVECCLSLPVMCTLYAVHRNILDCPARHLPEWLLGRLGVNSPFRDKAGSCFIVVQGVLAGIVVLLLLLHSLLIMQVAGACKGFCAASAASGGLMTGANLDLTTYHSAALHQVGLLVLSEVLMLPLSLLAPLQVALSVVVSLSLAMRSGPNWEWAVGWVLMNATLGLLVVRSNETRKRKDFFLNFVSEEGTKETLNMLFAMLPATFAQPLLEALQQHHGDSHDEGQPSRQSYALSCWGLSKTSPVQPVLPSSSGPPCVPLRGERVHPAPPPAPLLTAPAHQASTQSVALLMFDLVGFTKLSAAIGPHRLVSLLDKLYASFDRIVSKREAYKVETIGDAFLVCCGAPIPVPPSKSAVIVAKCAVDMLRKLSSMEAPRGHTLQARIGIHVGQVMAGVIGSQMPRYQLFGKAVDHAMLMESSGQPGRVHASAAILPYLEDCPLLAVEEALDDGSAFIGMAPSSSRRRRLGSFSLDSLS